MIICKTSETNENYDKIVFARRDVKEIMIPSFIKTIGSDASDLIGVIYFIKLIFN